jgi:hypothetical protein
VTHGIDLEGRVAMDANNLPDNDMAVIDAVFQGPLPLAPPPTPVRGPNAAAPADRPVQLSTDRPVRIGRSPLRNYLRELQREFEEQEAKGKL